MNLSNENKINKKSSNKKGTFLFYIYNLLKENNENIKSSVFQYLITNINHSLHVNKLAFFLLSNLL